VNIIPGGIQGAKHLDCSWPACIDVMENCIWKLNVHTFCSNYIMWQIWWHGKAKWTFQI